MSKEKSRKAGPKPQMIFAIMMGGALAGAAAGRFLSVDAIFGPPTVPTIAVSPEEADRQARAAHEQALDYLKDPARNNQLGEAARAFGQAVLTIYNQPDNRIGHFEVTCLAPGEYEGAATKWVSRGHIPQPGENCTITHQKSFGGSPQQIDLNVGVDQAGHFDLNRIGWVGTNNFQAPGDPDAPKKSSVMNYSPKYWGTQTYFDGATHHSDIQPAPGNVEFVDNYAINYLQQVTTQLG